MSIAWQLLLSFLQQEVAEQTENQLLFLDPSEKSGGWAMDSQKSGQTGIEAVGATE